MLGQGLIDGFAFDIELFHLVERNRLSLVEVPVQVANSDASTVRVGPRRPPAGARPVPHPAHAAAGRYPTVVPDPEPADPVR